MEIPSVFNIPGAKFTLMAEGSKFPPIIPREEWQLPENGHNFDVACKHYGNVGILAGITLEDGSVTLGFDQDQPEVFESLCLPETTLWETRPGRTGMLFTCDDIPPELRAEYGKKPDLAQFKFYKDGKGVGEIKMERTYQVIPNSWKVLDLKDGGARVEYKMLSEVPPAQISITSLVHAIMAIPGVSLSKSGKASDTRGVKPVSESTIQGDMPEEPDAAGLEYGRQGLLRELAKVEKTLEGGRYDQVYASGCALGELIGGKFLPLDATARALVEAGEVSGLTRHESMESAQHGIEKGMLKPRRLQRPTSTTTEDKTPPPSPSSEDPEDAPIEADQSEEEAEEDEPYQAESPKEEAESPEESDEVEDADEAEIKAAAPKEITVEDVSDIHYNRKGEEDGLELSVTKAARAIAKKMRIVMSEESPDIYRFDGETYKPDGSRIVDMKLCSLLGDEITIVKFKEVERRIKNTLLSSPVKFEPNPYLLAVKNGVVDLCTGKFRGFLPEDLLLEMLDITYDPKARCPVFCGYMTSITNVIVDRLTLVDWFAAHAIKVPIPYVLFLLGIGRNGKGIYEKLLKEFYGQCSFRDFAIDAPEKNNFAASALFRKRGWVAAESKTSKKEPTIGTEFMKLITGNGVIDGDRKNIGRIVFEPYTQITVDSNSMPRINDRSIGWEERLAKINLPYLFLEALVAGDPQVKVADPDLFKKLTSPDELSGILNLIIYRCKEICRTKRITKRPGKEMIKEYAEQSSSIDTFLKEFCEYEATASNLLQPFAPIFAAFENWCQLTVSEKVDEGYFGKQLKKLCGNMPPKKTKDKERNNVNLYRGLIFDEIKYKATIKKLQDGFKEENVYSVPSVSIGMSTEEKSPLITMSTVSIVNQWNEILKRFSIPFISYIGKETPDLVQTLQTLQTSATGDIEEVPKTVSIVNQEIETPVDKSGAPGLDGINLDEIGECKDASIPDEPTLTPVGGRVPDIATPSVVKSEHDKFMSEVRKHATRQQKRTCHICGLEADHDLIRDDSSRDNVNCYICTTCLISHRVKSKAQGEVPATSSPQTSLSDVALVT